ncbi:DUF4310 family protein [Serratia ureilytica]
MLARPPACSPGRCFRLYGIGAFNEVAFVSMLRAGMDTGVYGAVAAFGASFLFARAHRSAGGHPRHRR